MTDLSPTAQAVLDAWLSWTCLTRDPEREALAAALRAVADEVVPDEPMYSSNQRWMYERDARQSIRSKLLAIANELRGDTTTTQENN